MSKQEEIDFIRACFEQAKVLNHNYAREMLEDIFPMFAENTKNDFFTTPYADSKGHEKVLRDASDYRIKCLKEELEAVKELAAGWERRLTVTNQKIKAQIEKVKAVETDTETFTTIKNATIIMLNKIMEVE